MGIRSEKPIYQILEQKLKETAKLVTCVALMEDKSVRAAAIAEYGEDVRVATNKLSDALGLMWRRGLLIKSPSPKEGSSLARWAYIWDRKKDTIMPAPVPSPSLPKTAPTWTTR